MNRRRFGLLALFAFCSMAPFFAMRAAGSESREIVVFAATSLREVFQSMAQSFEKQNPKVKVRFNFAGSQELRVQIEQGAEVDVFASADWKHLKQLAIKTMVDQPAVFARNLPVLVVPRHNPAKVHNFADLSKARHLVVGASEVPIGAYTDTILASAQKTYGKAFHEKIMARLRSRELNVRQVLTKVVLGEADAGIVYRTDAQTVADKIQTIEIPAAINVVAEYPIATLKAAPEPDLAHAFVEMVLSRQGQETLAAAGFSRIDPSGAN